MLKIKQYFIYFGANGRVLAIVDDNGATRAGKLSQKLSTGWVSILDPEIESRVAEDGSLSARPNVGHIFDKVGGLG